MEDENSKRAWEIFQKANREAGYPHGNDDEPLVPDIPDYMGWINGMAKAYPREYQEICKRVADGQSTWAEVHKELSGMYYDRVDEAVKTMEDDTPVHGQEWRDAVIHAKKEELRKNPAYKAFEELDKEKALEMAERYGKTLDDNLYQEDPSERLKALGIEVPEGSGASQEDAGEE